MPPASRGRMASWTARLPVLQAVLGVVLLVELPNALRLDDEELEDAAPGGAWLWGDASSEAAGRLASARPSQGGDVLLDATSGSALQAASDAAAQAVIAGERGDWHGEHDEVPTTSCSPCKEDELRRDRLPGHDAVKEREKSAIATKVAVDPRRKDMYKALSADTVGGPYASCEAAMLLDISTQAECEAAGFGLKVASRRPVRPSAEATLPSKCLVFEGQLYWDAKADGDGSKACGQQSRTCLCKVPPLPDSSEVLSAQNGLVEKALDELHQTREQLEEAMKSEKLASPPHVERQPDHRPPEHSAAEVCGGELKHYQVSNGQLHSHGLGLACRRSRNLVDVNREKNVLYGGHVEGLDCGDWVQVPAQPESCWLPKALDGFAVLVQGDANAEVVVPVAQTRKHDEAVGEVPAAHERGQHTLMQHARGSLETEPNSLGAPVGGQVINKDVLPLPVLWTYLVDNSQLRSRDAGVACRKSKQLHDFDKANHVIYGTYVDGVETGDGWLLVGKCYLPLKVDGKPILVAQPNWKDIYNGQPLNDMALGEGEEHYLVDNRKLKSKEAGIKCRLSKDLKNTGTDEAIFGSIIKGRRDGEGWVEVNKKCWLPMQEHGKLVLLKQMVAGTLGIHTLGDYIVENSYLQSRDVGVQCYADKDKLAKKLPQKVAFGTIVRGSEEGAGWVKVGDCYLQKVEDGKPVLIMNGVTSASSGGLLEEGGGDDLAPGAAIAAVGAAALMAQSPEHAEESRYPGAAAAAAATIAAAAGLPAQAPLQGAEMAAAPVRAVPTSASIRHTVPQRLWRVDNSQLKSSRKGLQCRKSKDLDDLYPIYFEYGSTVKGAQAGLDWVHVGSCFLPIFLDRKRVLVPAVEKESKPSGDGTGVPKGKHDFLVDNSVLRSHKYGLNCRRSMHAKDMIKGRRHRYGTVVRGEMVNKEWLLVGSDCYLPVWFNGIRLLIPQVSIEDSAEQKKMAQKLASGQVAPSKEMQKATKDKKKELKELEAKSEEADKEEKEAEVVLQRSAEEAGNAEAKAMEKAYEVDETSKDIKRLQARKLKEAVKEVEAKEALQKALKQQGRNAPSPSAEGAAEAPAAPPAGDAAAAFKPAPSGSLLETDDDWNLPSLHDVDTAMMQGMKALMKEPDSEPSSPTPQQASVHSHGLVQPSPSANAKAGAATTAAAQAAEYLVDNSLLKSPKEGLACRKSPSVQDIDFEHMAKYGSVVMGVDLGNGWLKVGSQCFLPTTVNGKQVLVLQRQAEYLVDNSELRSAKMGYSCFGTPNLQDPKSDGSSVSWKTVIKGTLEGKGWIVADGECFLPLNMNGKRVLIEQGRYLVDDSKLKSSKVGLACRRSKNMDDVDPDHHALYGTVVRGSTEGDGWLKVDEKCYLPMKTQGVQVLQPKAWHAVDRGSQDKTMPVLNAANAVAAPGVEAEYFVQNALNRKGSVGIRCRRSKSLDDLDNSGQMVRYNTTIRGIDERDGWIRTKECFLPKSIDGQQILLPKAATIIARTRGDAPADDKQSMLQERAGAHGNGTSLRPVLEGGLVEERMGMLRDAGGGVSPVLAMPVPEPQDVDSLLGFLFLAVFVLCASVSIGLIYATSLPARLPHGPSDRLRPAIG
eukprot:TRINITY_DN32619_c0_g1_i1.p1 TRINITY_DN32619_c0_g1~~TRINITY_DN32619_c0_g1_i1.p1  ORF type:complete len:1601 (-),score=438.76 TRINITY_DN32619_c0_g1_i1:180-4982(-)